MVGLRLACIFISASTVAFHLWSAAMQISGTFLDLPEPLSKKVGSTTLSGKNFYLFIEYKTFSNFSTGRRLPLKLLHERRKRNRKERARTPPWTLFLRDSSPTTHLRRAALPKSRPVPPLANLPIKGRCLNLPVLERHQCCRYKSWRFHWSLTHFSEKLVKILGKQIL